MRLERVHIEGFGPLSGFDAALEPKRLNLLLGPNESGKSSFAAAVTATLFGHSSPQAEARAKPWSGGRYAATVTFSSGGSRYRVARDFETHAVRVDRLRGSADDVETTLFDGVANPRGRTAERSQYDELLRGWFGFSDARLFAESCFVHESALETQVSPELRHLITGAVEADYQQIEDALHGRLEALTREHPYDPRARKRANRSIEIREERLTELRERRARAETVLDELKSKSAEREAIEGRLIELRADLGAKEQLLSDLESLTRLREDLRTLLKRAPAVGQELVLSRRARTRLEEIDRKIADGLAYLANAPEEVENDLLRLGFLRTQRSKHQRAVESARSRRDTVKPPSATLGTVLGALLGGGIAAFVYLQWKLALAAAGAFVGAGLVGFTIARMLGRSAGRTQADADAQLRVAEENIRTLSQEVDQTEIRVNPYLEGRTLDIVLADLKQYRQLQQERREQAAVIHSLPMPERLEAEAKEIDEAVATLRAKEKLLQGQSPFLAPLRDDPVKTAEAADRLRREAAGLRTRIEAEQESLDEIARRAGVGGDADAENIEALDEAIAQEEAELAREERQRDALFLAIEVLRESVLGYQQEHVGRLARSAGGTMERLTGGRYKRVELDADLKPELALDGRDGVPVESLSRGAHDAFYLSLRAALARELAAREPLPLLLDDPIAHFDENRRAVLLGYLEELAADVQVVLLTHDRRVLDSVREAHVLAVGASPVAAHSRRKVQIR
jgi:energy-coupling factor transporter ATP-binding protein EcfA2